MGMMKKNCFILVGELSGEEHAQSFLPQLIKQNPDINFWGVGGSSMRSQGVETLYDLKDFSSVGFTEVYKKFHFYRQARKKLLAEVIKRQTKVAILVDFQGFNMSLLKPLHEAGVKILYFVAPQAWAWKSWRTFILKKYLTKLYCILPFEEKWFKNRGVHQAVTVAHPSFSKFNQHINEMPQNIKNILWLPGSRKSEIQMHLPIFLKVKKLIQERFPEYKHLIVCSPALYELNFQKWLDPSWKIYNASDLATALSETTVAVAVSGTVTINCAFMEVPTVVCYKVNLLNTWVLKSFVTYKGFVSLANLLLNKKVYPELLQEDCNPQLLFFETAKFLEDNLLIQKTRQELHELKKGQQLLINNASESMQAYLKSII